VLAHAIPRRPDLDDGDVPVRDVSLDLEVVPEVLRHTLPRPQSDPVKIGLRKHDQPRSSVALIEILRTFCGLDADYSTPNPV